MIKTLLITIFMLCSTIYNFAAIKVTSPSSDETIQAAEDYATAAFQDPWDMNEQTDLGWFIFDVTSGSRSNLTNISFSNGIFSASSTTNDPNISILETGVTGTCFLGTIGANYKIDADKYKIFAIRMKMTGTSGSYEDALLFWSRNTIYKDHARTNVGEFKTYTGWGIYIIDIPNQGYTIIHKKSIGYPWSGDIDSLRFDPASDYPNIEIDWIRLVEDNNDLYRTIRWTGNSGNVDICLDNDTNSGNGILGVVARNVSGTSYQLYVGALSPDVNYYVGVKNSSGGSYKYSSGYYRVNDIPTIIFTSPSAEGGDDFATVELNNPWDMNAISDFDLTYRVNNKSITSINAENLKGDSLGSVPVLKGTSQATSPHGDPVLYTLLWWGDGRGQANPIDSDKYRILVLKMSLPGNWDLVGGSVARVIWKIKGEGDNENVSEDVIIRHKSGSMVMNTIIADMNDLPLEAGANSPSHTGWAGMVEGFRVDPHEFSAAKDFYVQEIKLAAFERADESYTVKWIYTDDYSTSPSLSLYVDDNDSGYDGLLIKENIIPSQGQNQYTVDTSGVPDGTYYTYAVFSDGLNSNRAYARWPIVIDHTPVASPTISLSKTSLSFAASGSNSQNFTISNSGGGTLNWSVSDNRSWMSVSPTSGQNSGTVTVTVYRSGLSAGTYPGTVTVKSTNATNSPQTISVTLTVSDSGNPKIKLNRTNLYFGASGSKITSPQTFLISNSGTGTLNWSVSDNKSWLSVSPKSGTNSGTVTVTASKSGLSVGTYPGAITVSDSNASNSPQTISVTLKVYKSGSTSKPFGEFSTPTQGSEVRSSVPVTGWVLDDTEVLSVKIYNGSSYIGDAVFVEGARPDVEQAYPTYPISYRAGWGYMMLTYFLPNGGNGKYTIYAKATDSEGHVVTLGSKTITIDNNNAVKPFGAIDTPAQGGTASGSSYINWGWVLTPQPNKISKNGSTINVYVNGVNLGHPTYNLYRSDIASFFPSYANSEGAIGNFILNTTGYENGVHTIQWTASDTGGNSDGIGSRYFNIQNTGGDAKDIENSTWRNRWDPVPGRVVDIPVDESSPITIIKGFNRSVESRKLYPYDKGIIYVEIKELERLVIQLNVNTDMLGSGYTGYLLVDSLLKPLPIGSTIDTRRGLFYWIPGPGFIGNYLLVFTDNNRQFLQKINIKISPKYSLQ